MFPFAVLGIAGRPPSKPGADLPGPPEEPAASREYLARTSYQDPAVASRYEAVRLGSPIGRFLDKREKRSLRRALDGLPRRASILELACGTGRMTRVLLERGFSTLGADISLPMMEQSRAALGGMEGNRGLVRCDASRLPFKDRSFEAVVAIRFIAHLPPAVRNQVFSEAARVSRGPVVFSGQSPWSLTHLYRRLVKWRSAAVRTTWIGGGKTRTQSFSPRALERETSRHGLSLEATHRVLPVVAETYVARLKHA